MLVKKQTEPSTIRESALLARTTLEPGLCILHGNRLEDLTHVLVDWVKTRPLSALEDEIFLVQSNGMAQWLKLSLAADSACGISAAQQFQMPARFLWQVYRDVLGDEAVPRTSPFDKSRLVWRLMRLLPELCGDDTFAPLQRFLRDDQDQRKCYQLAERLADLYDQYQVYRADWLEAWQQDDNRIFRPGDRGEKLEDNLWQAELWRRLLADMPEDSRESSRASIHTRFIEALNQGTAPEKLPARIIVFGLSSLPLQALEALHALSRHCQILMMVQNPCQHYWGDIIEDRALLRHQQQRHQAPQHLAGIDPDLSHRNANPLLASWGKQGRDYIGLLYDHDVPEHYQGWFNQIDLFQAPESDSLLGRIQQNIFDLEPLPETPEPIARDHSLAFHLAHGPQREVEILHDQLLHRFQLAAQQGEPLQPRDVIVMVPDIEKYAAHIEAVFGNIPRDDNRHIPYTISDRSSRHTRPLAIALETLLQMPQLRFTLADLLDLLDVSALRRRFAIQESDLPLLRDWARGAGVRWGLHGEQRAAMDLPAGLEQNSWWFGLKRMLLGYASGAGDAWQDIEPYDEVGGLQADVAGKLAQLIEALEKHWRILSQPGTPEQWIERLQQLLDELFLVDDPDDIALRAGMEDALHDWQQACNEADFAQALPLSVASEAWLGALDQSSLSQRFLAGRVNFCTLMPMRSIPFRLVCLLGMNDGDYPRSQTPQDFDLMARRGQYRPGDRSRRDDDRYLFLEALLAARNSLYISWVGRNVRDNETRPPSVLVAQLRDYIDSAWQIEGSENSTSKTLSLEHPLQPFSRLYFQKQADNNELFSYAHEWHAVHQQKTAVENRPLPAPASEEPLLLTPTQLTRFLKNPVQHFFSERLKIRFDEDDGAEPDSEPFSLDGLESHQLTSFLLDATWKVAAQDRDSAFASACEKLHRTGQLPVGAFAEKWLEDIRENAWQALDQWWQLCADFPNQADTRELEYQHRWQQLPLTLNHWLVDIRSNDADALLQAELTAGAVKGRPDKCLSLWSRHLLANACGQRMTSCLVGHDARLMLRPIEQDEALAFLNGLLDAWCEGLCRPLPLACRTGFAWVKASGGKSDPLSVAAKKYDSGYGSTGEVDYANHAALKRSYPNFAALTDEKFQDQPAFCHWASVLYEPLIHCLSEEENA